MQTADLLAAARAKLERCREMGRAATARPWKLDGAGCHTLIRGADVTIVAVRHRLPRETHEANFGLITAAANSWDASLDAIEALVEMLERGHRDTCDAGIPEDRRLDFASYDCRCGHERAVERLRAWVEAG